MTTTRFEQDMADFGEFERNLEKALANLYNPTHWPPESIWAKFGVDQQKGLKILWSAVSASIEELKPDETLPARTAVRRIYLLLKVRFIERISQEEAAERFGVTPRHLRREQVQAVHALARQVWQRCSPATQSIMQNELPGPASPPVNSRQNEYQMQVKREVDSLSETTPGMISDVNQAIVDAAQFGQMLAEKHSVIVEINPSADNLKAAIHPAVLRQTLISFISQLSEKMEIGKIILQAVGGNQITSVTLTCTPYQPGCIPNIELQQEFLHPHDAKVEFQYHESTLTLQILLKSVGTVVLILDDNKDMAHLYKRYTTGTRYHIVSIDRGMELLKFVHTCKPEIILLDVMLPDADGWMLLSQLKENPETGSIPIIVCSVVREEALALMLGAKAYLQKPVQRNQFLLALDQASAH